MFNIRFLKVLLLVAILISFIFTGFVKSESQSDLLAKAAELYQSNNFQEAAKIYKQVLSSKINGYILYNLGNCYFKLNRIPQAIVLFEQASKLMPRDEDIKFNLDICRTLLKDDIEEPLPGMLTRITGFPLKIISLNEYCIMTSASYSLLMAAL